MWYRQESNWQKIEISDNSLGGARNFSVVDMDNGRDIEGNTDLDIVALAQTSDDVILFNNELIPAAPDIDFQPTALNFGEVNVGDTTKRSLHLSNSGTVLLQISAIQILGPRPTPFSLENTTAFSLNSCEVDSIVILCTPLDTGIWAGTLIISSNDNRDSVVTIELIVDRVTDVDDAPIPRSLRLSQNFPNPFNPSTEIICEIPSYGRTRLSVHDLLGREVALLINDLKPAGTYHVRFDGNGIPSGVYVYRILWNDRSISRKMILMK